MRAVLKALQQMMGTHERCMYCVDSHGSDIDHFRPKSSFPERAYQWSNMLLCCTECGRFKGGQFPMTNQQPTLIDPTAEDPWAHLDFDPDTGNLTARFELQSNDWSVKGTKTIEVLRLDRREALAAGYLKTMRRLTRIVNESLTLPDATGTGETLAAQLLEADDHGLLPWCLHGTGQTFGAFDTLRRRHPQTWSGCIAVLP